MSDTENSGLLRERDVPPAPGVFSAFELLVTDLKHEYSTTRIRRTDQLDVSEISGVVSTMADQGRTLLRSIGRMPI